MSAMSVFWFFMILALIGIICGRLGIIPADLRVVNEVVLWILLALLGWKGPFGAMVK